MSELEKHYFQAEPQFISDIKTIIEKGRQLAYTSVNAIAIETYWKIGERIVKQEQGGNDRAAYGKQIIRTLSEALKAEYGDNFSERSLRECRQFYLCFNDLEIWRTCAPNLTWSHFRTLCRECDPDARLWYMNEAAREGWSVRVLQRNISTQYYHRLLLTPKPEAVKDEMMELTAPLQDDSRGYIKSPVVAEFLGLTPNSDYTESDLERSIITHLQHFIMELGKGYAFVARQKHIHTDAGDYFIDLKTTQISHQDVGQMDMYVRMYDELYRNQGHNPTIGLLLCSDTSKDIARYSVLHDNDRLFAAKYLTYIPSQEVLQAEIEKQKQIFMLQHTQEEEG